MIRTFNKYIFVLGFFLCATVLSRFTQDLSLTIRHAVWAAITLMLFFMVKGSIPKNKMILFFAGYLVLAATSLLWATNPIKGLNEVTKIALMLVSFCIACEVLQKDKEFFIKAMSILGLILGAYGLFEIITTGKADRCLGTMGIRNIWASAQFLTLPFCVSSIRKWPVIGLGSSALIIINLILLSNRASILALAVSGVILLVYYRKWRYIALVGMVILVSFIANPKLLNTESLDARYHSWSATIALARENPFFGTGINNWQLEIPRYATMFLEKDVFTLPGVMYQRPHNDFLWVLSEVGVFGVICYAGIFACGLCYAIKSRNMLALVGLAGYLVIATFSFPKERAFHSMMLVVYLALAVTGYKYKTTERYIVAKSLVLLVLCFAVAEFTLCHLSERHIRKMSIARDMKNWPGVLAESENVSRLRTIDIFTLPVAWFTAEAHYHLGNREQTIKDNFTAFRRSPNNIYVLDRMGQMFEGLGDSRAAEAFYRRALIIKPDFKFSLNKLNKLKGI